MKLLMIFTDIKKVGDVVEKNKKVAYHQVKLPGGRKYILSEEMFDTLKNIRKAA